MEQPYNIKSHWEVHRSRNKGQFWSNLTHGMDLSKIQAYLFLDREHEKHPSDWLRVVRVDEVVERGYNCYGHNPKEKSPLTEIKIFKNPIDIKKFNEVCKQSLGGLQTFKGNGE